MFNLLTLGRNVVNRSPVIRCILFSDFSLQPPLEAGKIVADPAGGVCRIHAEDDTGGVLPALEECKVDLSHYGPYHMPSFNLAAYADRSPTLRRLVEMGVNLHAVERMRGAAQVILRRDFERDMQNHIRFLNDCGVTGDSVGVYISKNPFIFTQDLDNLEVRINYLFSKQFTTDSISRILVKNPRWLMHSTEDIDRRLGYFQQNFLLKGDEVRFVATRQPKLITYNLDHIRDTRFAVIEEMGFTVDESKQIILRKPKVYTLNRRSLVERFDYIHNTMGIGHGLIIEQVGSLLSRLSRLKQRHQFLALLGRNIYDPAQPGYISLVDIVAGDDSCFCSRVAKTPTAIFNKFLKTL